MTTGKAKILLVSSTKSALRQAVLCQRPAQQLIRSRDCQNGKPGEHQVSPNQERVRLTT